MRGIDQLLRLIALQAGQVDEQIGGNAEPAGIPRTDPHGRCHGGGVGHLHLQLLASSLQRADEAGRITRGEQLFGVGAIATRAAQFLGRRQFGFETAVLAAGIPFTAASGGGAGGVFDVDGHDACSLQKLLLQ